MAERNELVDCRPADLRIRPEPRPRWASRRRRTSEAPASRPPRALPHVPQEPIRVAPPTGPPPFGVTVLTPASAVPVAKSSGSQPACATGVGNPWSGEGSATSRNSRRLNESAARHAIAHAHEEKLSRDHGVETTKRAVVARATPGRSGPPRIQNPTGALGRCVHERSAVPRLARTRRAYVRPCSRVLTARVRGAGGRYGGDRGRVPRGREPLRGVTSDNGADVNFGVVRVPELPAPARGGASHLFAPGTSASAAAGP